VGKNYYALRVKQKIKKTYYGIPLKNTEMFVLFPKKDLQHYIEQLGYVEQIFESKEDCEKDFLGN